MEYENRLVLIAKIKGTRKSLYQCICGMKIEAFTSNVSSGKTRSCGCLQKEAVILRSTKHGNARRGKHSREYESWNNMVSRCTRVYRHDYHRYGGRGIKVCQEWLTDFNRFLKDMGECPSGLTLDRKDNASGYSKENCKWSTPKEQANNRRSNVFISHNGDTKNIESWAVELGIKRGTIESRIKRGVTDPKLILAPVNIIQTHQLEQYDV